MVFLDANPVIYLIEQPPTLGGPKTTARVTELLAGGERLAATDLVSMECKVGPLKVNDHGLLGRYVTFFRSPDVSILSITAAVCDRAARIRAEYGFKPLDSLHLAAAVEYRCSRFLSNDAKLKRFPDILVEILS